MLTITWIPQAPSGARITSQIRRAVSAGINAGVDKGYSESSKLSKRASTARISTYRKRSGTDKSRVKKLRGAIWIGGKPLSSNVFKSVDKYPNGVTVYINRSSPHHFPSAFRPNRAATGSQYRLVLQRRGSSDKLYDPVFETGIGFADILYPYKRTLVDVTGRAVLAKMGVL